MKPCHLNIPGIRPHSGRAEARCDIGHLGDDFVSHDTIQAGGFENRLRRDDKLRTPEGRRILDKFQELRMRTVPVPFARGMARGLSLKPIATTHERMTTVSI